MELVHNRRFHHAFVHADRIVVWGGFQTCIGGRPWPTSEIIVYDPGRFSWTRHETRGVAPPPPIALIPTAQLVGDDMYVIHSGLGGPCLVYKLNLISLLWKEVETTGGMTPETECHVNAWPHGESGIVVVSAYDGSLSVLDTEGGVWWRPTCRGDALPRHIYHVQFKVFTIGSDLVYILGSKTTDEVGGGGGDEMYRLDMASWTWERMRLDLSRTEVHGVASSRHDHSLTVIPPVCQQQQEQQNGAKAILYGGWHEFREEERVKGNCSMLHLGEGLLYHWTRCDHLDAGARQDHVAVVEAVTGQVWLLGGGVNNTIKLTVTRPLSLVMSCFKAMVEERDGRLREGIEELPERLRSNFNAFVKTEIELE